MFIIEVKVPNQQKIFAWYEKELPKVAKRIMREAVKEWKTELSESLKESLSGGVINAQTKRLLKVAKVSNIVARETDDGFEVYLKHVPPYGAIHETGGTIRPRSGGYLAIPIGPAKKAKVKMTPRRYKNTFLLPYRGVRGAAEIDWVVMWKKSKTEVVPIFLYTKQVDLPSRPWFATAVRDAWPKLLPLVKKKANE